MISGIDRIKSFEITIIVCLLFTWFECEEMTVGMVPADTGYTGAERLDSNCILLTIFTLLSFIHGKYLRDIFSDILVQSVILFESNLTKGQVQKSVSG